MAVNYVTVKGFIKDGKLEVELPDDTVEGEVELRVPVERKTIAVDEIESAWTDEELEDLINPQPKTGAEIVALGHTGGWEHKSIEDSIEWVKELRRQRREKRGW
jgi:hypothetical protein